MKNSLGQHAQNIVRASSSARVHTDRQSNKQTRFHTRSFPEKE